MAKRMIIMLIFVGVLFGGIFGYHAFSSYMMKAYFASSKEPPAVVSTIKAESQMWQPKIKSVGSLRAVRGVEVASEVSGVVEGVYFSSGDKVRAGQDLIKLNADTDNAQLQALEAAADLASTVYERDKKQLEAQAVSQAVVDADAAELKNRRAQVVQQKAFVAKKVIRAPFDGRLGISRVNPGQYVDPGEKVVTLQALDQVYVDFFVPQQHVSRIAVGQAIYASTDSYPGRSFSGKVSAVNPKVESDSRNIQVEALIENAKHELLPGMFASVEVLSGSPEDYITLPQTAVTFNPYGETVYIVAEAKGEDGKPVLTAKQVFITTGDTRGDQIAVLTGVSEGDTVVTSGQLKLRNGSAVSINNEIQPGNDPAPKPIDN